MEQLTFESRAFTGLRLTKEENIHCSFRFLLVDSLLANHVIDRVADLFGIDFGLETNLPIDGRLVWRGKQSDCEGIGESPSTGFLRRRRGWRVELCFGHDMQQSRKDKGMED